MQKNKDPIFTFEDLATEKGAIKALDVITRIFTRAGIGVIPDDALAASMTKVKRTSGVTYREITVNFIDSQKVVFRIKSPGDIYQVTVNGKLIPIRNQDDHKKAIAEIIAVMDKDRSRVQKALLKTKVELPKTIRTAAPKMIEVLTQKRDGLKEAIATVVEETNKLNALMAA
jgi:hypothetical protein